MKKLVLAIAVLILPSCDFMKVHMDGWANPVNSEDEKIDVSQYEYNGHIYQVWGHTLFTNGIVHDPDCPCHQKEE